MEIIYNDSIAFVTYSVFNSEMTSNQLKQGHRQFNKNVFEKFAKIAKQRIKIFETSQ